MIFSDYFLSLQEHQSFSEVINCARARVKIFHFDIAYSRSLTHNDSRGGRCVSYRTNVDTGNDVVIISHARAQKILLLTTTAASERKKKKNDDNNE